MDVWTKKSKISPEENAGFLSKIFFWWMNPYFGQDVRTKVSLDDIHDVPTGLAAQLNGSNLDIAWSKECQDARKLQRRPKFYKALGKVFWKNYIWCSLVLIFDELIIRLIQAIFLRKFIASFGDSDSVSINTNTFYDKLFNSCGFLFVTLQDTFLINAVAHGFFKLGYSCNASINSLIYRKVLRLSMSSQRSTTMGQVMNLMNIDSTSFQWTIRWTPYLFYVPIQTLVLTYYLWTVLGPYCFTGVGLYIAVIPLQYLFGKLTSKYKKEATEKADRRTQIITEIIMAVRVIKMYAWEFPFINLVEKTRNAELGILKKSASLKCAISVMHSALKIVTYATIISYISSARDQNNDLEQVNGAEKVFFSISIFMIFRESLAGYIPLAASCLGELLAALKRIEDFLILEEQPQDKRFVKTSIETEEKCVEFRGVEASWNEGNKTLNNVTFTANGNKLVLISGNVGSGKSSLLSCIVEELPLEKGACRVNGVISYASQDAWIFPGTIRQNILFGQPYDKCRYSKILKICSLEEDLSTFVLKDLCKVSEKGGTLSGGQKGRVNLARCLYKKADIYLLDDPLSSVDSRVSRHIFENAIKDFLRDKLVFLVTHHLHFSSQVDQIIILHEGRIVKQNESTTNYSEFTNPDIKYNQDKTQKSNSNHKSTSSTLKRNESFTESSKEISTIDSNSQNPWKIAWDYFKCGNSILKISIIFCSFLIFQLLDQLGDYWLSYWTDKKDTKYTKKCNFDTNNDQICSKIDQMDQKPNENYYLTYFTLILVAVLVLSIFRSFSYYFFSLRISRNIHSSMLKCILNAKISFFDVNQQSGRILNRFTKDINILDQQLPQALFECLYILLSTMGSIILVSCTNSYSIVPAIILIGILWNLRKKFQNGDQSIKNLTYQMRSPMITHLSSTIQGLSTIRASKSEFQLMGQFDRHMDNYGAPLYIHTCARRWFSIWIEFVSLFFLIFVTFTFLFIEKGAGTVGLTITSIISLTGSLKWGMRQSAETEVLMTSIERALDYTLIESEDSTEFSAQEIQKNVEEFGYNWPQSGSIRFENVSLSYDNGSSETLKNLNFEIKPLEKIGIIGRTGAGKSSIVLALLRMVESRGSIYIDNKDISKIPISHLRNGISVIPQNPVLFSGTIRFNLDPFGRYSSEQIYDAISQVELSDQIKSLDSPVLQEGLNFSVGQRQLLCLARALLRKNKIIIMDEATANCDNQTDLLIQKTLQNKFSNCTKILIAHRLNTILDSNRILVLDNGQIKEFDEPQKLLSKHNGIFKSMVENIAGFSGKLNQHKMHS